MSKISLQECLNTMPLVAVLRGIAPDEVLAVGETLVEAGFKIMEVTINSLEPLESIRLLADAYGSQALVGAGTVLSAEIAIEVANAGGRLIVMPHADTSVIRAGKTKNCFVLAGISTPTEAFAALKAGADGLKLFPAEGAPPAVLQAMRAVLPAEVPVLPVGGITTETMGGYWAVGASGFGLGSNLYKAGKSNSEIKTAADAYVRTMNELRR